MKDIKCPLCRTNSEYFLHEIGTNPYYATTAKLFGCPTCKVGFNHPDGWKEYVSKFPPIMRVQVGDNVITHDGEVVVKNKDMKDLSLYVGRKDECTSEWILQDEIYVYPWELEQNGEAEQ